MGDRGQEMMELIYEIFIANGALATIGKGIDVTVEISLVALLIGTLLGSVLCLFRMGNNSIMRFLSGAYSSRSCFQGKGISFSTFQWSAAAYSHLPCSYDGTKSAAFG